MKHVLLCGLTDQETINIGLEMERQGFKIQPVRINQLEQIYEALKTSKWDVVLARFHSNHESWSESIAGMVVKHGGAPVIVIGDGLEPDLVVKAVNQGARGWVPVDNLSEYLPQTVNLLFDSPKPVARHPINEPASQSDFDWQPLQLDAGFLKILLNIVGALVVVTDADGFIFGFNQMAEQVTGYRFDEVRGRRYHEVILFPENKEEVDLVISDLINTTRSNVHDNPIKTKSGEARFIHWTNSVILDNTGKGQYVVATGVDVTEQHQRTLELEASEMRFRIFFESSPLPTAILSNDDLKFIDVNPQMEEFAGLKRTEIIGKTAIELGFFRDPQEVIAIQQTWDQRIVKNKLEVSVTTPSGNRDILATIEYVDLQGKHCMVAQLVDITELKRIEERTKKLNDELEERVLQRTADLEAANHQLAEEILQRQGVEASQLRLVEILQETPDIVAISDLDGMVKYLNRTGQNLYADMIAQKSDIKVVDAYSEESRRFIQSVVRPHVFRQGVWHGELEMMLPDGRLFPVSQVIILHRNADGQPDFISAIARDISMEKQSQLALKQSEERYRTLAEAAQEIIFVINAQDIVEYVNNFGSQFLGLYPEAVVGKHIRELFPANIASVQIRALRRVFEIGRPLYAELPNEGAGKKVWLGTWLSPIFNADGAVSAVLGIARDITSRIQTELRLTEALEREKDLGELRSQLVQQTSHGFRTPLSVILSSAEILERYSGQWDVQKQIYYLRRIQDNAQQMDRLLTDVLSVGRADANKVTIEPTKFNLDLMCTQLINELKLIDKEEHVLIYQSDLHTPQVLMDRGLLDQVLDNLLSNARKYSPIGTTIKLIVTQMQNDIQIEVSDEGIGIPEKDQPQIYQAFMRGRNAGHIKGVGLGLKIVHQSVQIMGGSIRLFSQENQGTKFLVTLPADQSGLVKVDNERVG